MTPNVGRAGRAGGRHEHRQQRVQSPIEKQLFAENQAQKERLAELVQELEKNLSARSDLSALRKKYDKLLADFRQLQSEARDEVGLAQDHTKTIEMEIIALAARNSALEEQKREMQTIVDQRDYEIQLLTKQMELHRQGTTQSVAFPFLLSLISSRSPFPTRRENERLAWSR